MREFAEVTLAPFIIALITYFIFKLLNIITRNETIKRYSKITYHLGVFAILASLLVYPKLVNIPDDGWNEKEEENLKKVVIRAIETKGFPLFDKQKVEFSECVLEQVKLRYPNWSKKDKEELPKVIFDFSFKCIDTILTYQKLNGWTTEFENHLAQQLFRDPTLVNQFPDSIKRIELSNCVVGNIKRIYPTGLNGTDLNNKSKEFKSIELYKDCIK